MGAGEDGGLVRACILQMKASQGSLAISGIQVPATLPEGSNVAIQHTGALQ